MKAIEMQANGFGIELRKEKNLHMDGTYIIIHFEDGYQMDLVDKYGWNEHQAENEVAKVIEKNLQKKGLDCHLHWEDREVFLIEKPSFSVHEVANVLMTMFDGAKIINDSSTNFLSKILRKFGMIN